MTEGRTLQGAATGVHYSSCGDLPNWLLARLGLFPGWLNREEAAGWRVGQNVSAICARPWGANPIARQLRSGDSPEPGDVLVLDASKPASTHALVVLSWSASELVSGDYGQTKDPRGHSAEGAIVHRDLVHTAHGVQAGVARRSVDSWLRLSDVVDACEAAGQRRPADDLAAYAEKAGDPVAPELARAPGSGMVALLAGLGLLAYLYAGDDELKGLAK